MGAAIRSLGAYVPKRRMSNHEFEEFLDTSDEWIQSHTGIKFRHVASDDEAPSDLGHRAAAQALERAGLPADQLGMVLVATASGDHVGFPSTACIIQDKLGACNAAAMDLLVGCTGFVYGLETAKGLIACGAAEHILLVGSEVLTRIMDWEDRNTAVLFGDGAGAAVILPLQQRLRHPGLVSALRRLGCDGAGTRGGRHPFAVQAGQDRPPPTAPQDGGKDGL